MPKDPLDCPKNNWVKIKLVDGQGNGEMYANLLCTIFFDDPKRKSEKHTLDKDGFLELKNIPCGKVSIFFSELYSKEKYPHNDKVEEELQEWYNQLIQNGQQITQLQVSAEHTKHINKRPNIPSFPNSFSTTIHYTFEVSNLVGFGKHLPSLDTNWVGFSVFQNLFQFNLMEKNEYTDSNKLSNSDNSFSDNYEQRLMAEELKSRKAKMDGGIYALHLQKQIKEEIDPKLRKSITSKNNSTELTNTFQEISYSTIMLGPILSTGKTHIIYVKPLRAYRPLLSRSESFSALNLYQCTVLSNLVYKKLKGKDNKDTVSYILNKWSEHSNISVDSDELIMEDVPYSKRFQIDQSDKNFIIESNTLYNIFRRKAFKDYDTQAFITHHDNIILISIRGTNFTPKTWAEGIADISTDINFAKTKIEDPESDSPRPDPDFPKNAEAHNGFHLSYKAIWPVIKDYLDRYYKKGQHTVVVTGHSLGGAIATLLAIKIKYQIDKSDRLIESLSNSTLPQPNLEHIEIKKDNIQINRPIDIKQDNKPSLDLNNLPKIDPKIADIVLYTYGAPRVIDETCVDYNTLTHYRIVAKKDLVPSIPLTWLTIPAKSNSKIIQHPVKQAYEEIDRLIDGITSKKYKHHGKLYHFETLEPNSKTILWEPVPFYTKGQKETMQETDSGLPEPANVIKRSITDHMLGNTYIPYSKSTIKRWLNVIKGTPEVSEKDIRVLENTIMENGIRGNIAVSNPSAYIETYIRPYELSLARAKTLKNITNQDIYGFDIAKNTKLMELVNNWSK